MINSKYKTLKKPNNYKYITDKYKYLFLKLNQ